MMSSTEGLAELRGRHVDTAPLKIQVRRSLRGNHRLLGTA